jgi:hypothetical protein
MNQNCAAGNDGLPVKIIKQVVQHASDVVLSLLNTWYDEEELPQAANSVRLVPLPKVHDAAPDVSQWRPIAVNNALVHVYLYGIAEKLNTVVSPVLH